ncbi:hypothetical protein K388_01900 [Streptomyces sp. KhCrAH-43]|uniref:hypothetical protein n=1 Tax=unclassified Streptomyces TaxID=2593676 RepID=UPI00036832A9|nr:MULTISPECIES: hypothetical protein [unclassified Streptomyces]MYS34902.1 hypothetical protein [Streptomyces sp. SID4920]MYX65321.1 hypothetical protein [Streptomyces sp. SID8373]RAJ64705.1 hypothetical protein K388_01900 [Streptomyces sp. KhCrAH-43]
MSNVMPWLLYGAYIGAVLTATVHFLWTGRGRRRAAAASRAEAGAALKKASGDHVLAVFQLDRMSRGRRQA